MSQFKTVPPTEKISSEFKPYVTFPLIKVCTQKCVYCGDGAEMTLSDQRQFDTQELLEWHVAARSLGIGKFRITGGEPLLHRDFTTIVQTVAADASFVLINTNGTLMKKYREKWENSPSNCHYVVNYHGATEEVYDRVSATTGYYDVAREGIEMLAHAGLLHRLNAVMNKHNVHEIWDIIQYCRELGTNLKIQDVVSVPWSFNEWNEVYVNSTELEQEFEKRASHIREHRYSMHFGTPTKIYTIDGVDITLKSVRNGSHYDMEGICKKCPFFPCHEGVYDLFVFADNTAWACNWTDIAKAPKGSKKEQLQYMVDLFQRAIYRLAPRSLTEMSPMGQEVPEIAKLHQLKVL
jgi:molybdenum cofactor biosynthesis enzyme MoaA